MCGRRRELKEPAIICHTFQNNGGKNRTVVGIGHDISLWKRTGINCLVGEFSGVNLASTTLNPYRVGVCMELLYLSITKL